CRVLRYRCCSLLVLFFTDPATPQIYTLSLHDALPISLFCRIGERIRAVILDAPKQRVVIAVRIVEARDPTARCVMRDLVILLERSEEHTSELQSRENLVCRLLLEKKKKQDRNTN